MRDVDRRARKIAQLAGRQYGHITRGQLLALGLSSAAIGRGVAAGRLIRVHTGVYAVGHRRVDAVARAAAALLACGDKAVLSHESAAALWDLWPRWPDMPEVSGPEGRRRSGIRHHRTRTLTRREVRRHHGLAVTSPARTIGDLAPRLTGAQLTRAINDARLAGRLTRTEAERLTERLTQRLAARLGPVTPRPTRSGFEDVVLAALRDGGFPVPQVNARVLGCEVDLLFPAERLIVELDGYRYHADPATWEGDRRRDERTTVAGYVTLRITWQRWQEDPAAVLAGLRALLHARRATREVTA